MFPLAPTCKKHCGNSEASEISVKSKQKRPYPYEGVYITMVSSPPLPQDGVASWVFSMKEYQRQRCMDVLCSWPLFITWVSPWYLPIPYSSPTPPFSKHFPGHTFHPALLPLSILCLVSLIAVVFLKQCPWEKTVVSYVVIPTQSEKPNGQLFIWRPRRIKHAQMAKRTL